MFLYILPAVIVKNIHVLHVTSYANNMHLDIVVYSKISGRPTQSGTYSKVDCVVHFIHH